MNTSSVVPPGASSAFGLGSGAFASFGVSAKTPKTSGTAFDFNKGPQSASSPEVDKPAKNAAKVIDTTAQTSIEANASGSGSTKVAWPLKYSWVVWYRPPTSKNADYEKSIKPIYKMRTAQDFWRVYSHLKRPSALPTVSDYHFFKDGIRPVWEDDENKKGGKWIIRLKKGVMDRFWDEILLALIGDQFAEAGEEVCGVVVSVRSGEDVLSVWAKIDGGRTVKIRYALRTLTTLVESLINISRETIKRVLNLPADTVIVWKSHDDSIAQRTAIDQARQDGVITSKRRTTTSDPLLLGRDKSAVT